LTKPYSDNTVILKLTTDESYHVLEQSFGKESNRRCVC
jgi:hypothetical protein